MAKTLGIKTPERPFCPICYLILGKSLESSRLFSVSKAGLQCCVWLSSERMCVMSPWSPASSGSSPQSLHLNSTPFFSTLEGQVLLPTFDLRFQRRWGLVGSVYSGSSLIPRAFAGEPAGDTRCGGGGAAGRIKGEKSESLTC